MNAGIKCTQSVLYGAIDLENIDNGYGCEYHAIRDIFIIVKNMKGKPDEI